MKDPAFLFYSSDFLTGVTDLTMEERGQYITLLCLQHQKGHLSEKTIRLSVGSISVDVRNKFVLDLDGNLFNEILEKHIEERMKFTESRRNNGLKGGRPKSEEKPSAKPSAKPNEKPSANLSENENEIYKDIFIKYKNHILQQSVTERLAMNLMIKPNEIKHVINEFIETCYGEIMEKKNAFAVETYFINWVKSKENRVSDAINNQVKKQQYGKQHK